MIDSKDMLLYRELKDGYEQAIPIGDNKSMEKFMCIDKREYERLRKENIEDR